MNCNKCGEYLEDSWKVCPNCGEPIDGTNLQNGMGEKNVKKAVYKKWWFWLIIVLAVFAGLAIYGGSLPEESSKSKTQVNKVKDLSKYDFEDLLQKSEEDVQKIGLVKGEKPSEYEALDGNIKIIFKDKKINNILIQGNTETTPSFHGIRIGMEKDKIQGQLIDTYPEVTGTDTDMKFLNLDKKTSVQCTISDGKTNTIVFNSLSEEEITQYKKAKDEALRAQYVFPDSNSKYLSEDEVRSVEADKLLIGRNEIFARHGYIFEDEGLQQHFGDTTWYQGTVQGNQFNSDEVFNDFEKKNVELIKKVEDEVNGTGNNEQGSYIVEGIYTNNQIFPDCNGMLKVSYASVGWVEVKVYTAPAINELTMYGEEIDNNTIRVTEGNTGIAVTLHWNNANEVTLTSSGEFTGMDSALFNELTNAHFTLASGY